MVFCNAWLPLTASKPITLHPNPSNSGQVCSIIVSSSSLLMITKTIRRVAYLGDFPYQYNYCRNGFHVEGYFLEGHIGGIFVVVL